MGHPGIQECEEECSSGPSCANPEASLTFIPRPYLQSRAAAVWPPTWNCQARLAEPLKSSAKSSSCKQVQACQYITLKSIQDSTSEPFPESSRCQHSTPPTKHRVRRPAQLHGMDLLHSRAVTTMQSLPSAPQHDKGSQPDDPSLASAWPRGLQELGVTNMRPCKGYPELASS